MGLRWEYLGPWHEQNNQEGSFDPASGKIALQRHAVQSARRSWCRSIINQDGFFPAGILQKDLNNCGSARRRRLQRQRPDGGAQRLRRLLRQPQPERAAVLAARAAVLRAVLAAARRRTDLRCNVDTLFPDLNNIPEFPAPFSMDPANRTAVHVAVERATCSARFAQQLPVRGGVHGQPQLQRAQALQHQPGAAGNDADRRRACRTPAFQSAILYSSDAGWADVQRADVPRRQAVFGRALLPRQLPAVEEQGQRIRRNRSQRHGVRVESERRRGLRPLRSASSRRGQLRLRTAVRARQAVAVERRRGGVCASAAGRCRASCGWRAGSRSRSRRPTSASAGRSCLSA